MSILDPVPREELGSKYTHRGWLLGLVPVYVGDTDSDEPVVAARNGVPELWMWLVLALFAMFCCIADLLVADFEPSFSITITGRIEA